MKAWFTRKSLIILRSSWSSRFVFRRSRCKCLIIKGSSRSSWSSCQIIGQRERSLTKFRDRSLRLCGAIFYPAHSYGRAWTHEPIIIIIINNIIYLYKTSTYKLPPVQKNLVHLFKVKFQNMNRMNPLFYKAFLTPSKNHANHCQIMFDYKNQFKVKSQTALL